MHEHEESQRIFFVVLESGAHWPQDLDYRGLTDVHIVAQQADETNATFVRRIRDRLRRVRGEGGEILAASLVLNQRLSYSELAPRCSVARLLTSALVASDGAELLIRGKESTAEWHAHVVALAAALEDETRGSVRVSIELAAREAVRLAKAVPRSGVFPVVTQEQHEAEEDVG